MASGRDGVLRLPRSDELSREAAPLLAAVHGLRSGWMRRLLATADRTKKRRMLAADLAESAFSADRLRRTHSGRPRLLLHGRVSSLHVADAA